MHTYTRDVQINNFEGFLLEDWATQYSMMAVRHLEYAMDGDDARRLDAFVKAVCGKQYAWTVRLRDGDCSAPENVDDPARKFFCSEVVAAAYKELGLLRPSLPARKYVPGAFGAQNNLLLLRGALLSDEIQLVFDERPAAATPTPAAAAAAAPSP